MARIPEQEIERLKKDIALERLVEGRGVKLQRHGKDLIGLCPFHEDREPSLVVSPEKNLWLCVLAPTIIRDPLLTGSLVDRSRACFAHTR